MKFGGLMKGPNAPRPVLTLPKKATPKAAPLAPKRPSGQFQGIRETQGKVNGGGMGNAVHPGNHKDFEAL